METRKPKKKIWSKPAINVLDIKQVTTGGVQPGKETPTNDKYGPPGLSS